MATLNHVLEAHEHICSAARAIISKKGHDYNRQQQHTGETLFNLKVAKILGVVDTNTQSILIRICDKIMRLISLTKNPSVEAEVRDESIKDTIEDLINYAVYLYIVYQEELADANKRGNQ